jgi:hypothetical protein
MPSYSVTSHMLERSCIFGPLLFLRLAARVHTGEVVPRMEIIYRTGPPPSFPVQDWSEVARSAFGRFPRHAARLERSWDATAHHTLPRVTAFHRFCFPGTLPWNDHHTEERLCTLHGTPHHTLTIVRSGVIRIELERIRGAAPHLRH